MADVANTQNKAPPPHQIIACIFWQRYRLVAACDVKGIFNAFNLVVSDDFRLNNWLRKKVVGAGFRKIFDNSYEIADSEIAEILPLAGIAPAHTTFIFVIGERQEGMVSRCANLSIANAHLKYLTLAFLSGRTHLRGDNTLCFLIK